MNNEKVIVLVIDDMVVFPQNEIRIEYEKNLDSILNIIEKREDKLFLIVNPIEETIGDDITNLPKYGVLAKLKVKLKLQNDKERIIIEGLKRVEINNYTEGNNYFTASYKEIEKTSENNDKSHIELIEKALDKYIDKVPYMSNAIKSQIKGEEDLSILCDTIASFIPVSYLKKKQYLITPSPIKRAKLIVEDMFQELKFIDLEQKIEEEVEQTLSDAQKEYFLREKMHAIQKELGDANSKDDEVSLFRKKLKKLKCSNKIKEKINREINRYDNINNQSPELSMIREYLDWIFALPWGKLTKDNNNLKEVETTLNNSHYALKDVKKRVIEYLAVKQNTDNLRSPILCLVGPPGVGKTSFAYAVANSLGRKVAKISVGGINDESEILGHRRTYIGSSPGRIIQGMRKAKTSNPVFIIDEIDKMTKDYKGDPASSLLEVLDPEQNSKFSDHYIEEEFDLSKVLFIATANYIEQIPYELKDRLEIINVSSYTEYEKLEIAKNHLILKLGEEHGVTSLQVNITDDILLYLIRYYTKEAGVRELERVISSLYRKIVKEILVDKKDEVFDLDKKLVKKYLGDKKYSYNKINQEKEIGIVNGLSYTPFGGDVLPIEVNMFFGKGDLILTGSLGKVMKESAQIAYSYIKSNSEKFNIDDEIFNSKTIHIHVPEGAVEKEGPSAGIAITTVLISLFKQKAIDKKIAMTGEISLRGHVLPIGGLKEKIIGAHRSGVKTIFIPIQNKKEIKDIPKEIIKDINIKFATSYDEIYKEIFED